jgi:hypothetical protein
MGIPENDSSVHLLATDKVIIQWRCSARRDAGHAIEYASFSIVSE